MTLKAALILCSAASLSWAADSVPVATQPGEIITSARSSASGHSYLLFPYTVTNPSYDTEITIANTSKDTFGTPPQNGTCLLTFRGSGTVPAPQTTATIAAGKQVVFKMSEGGGGILPSSNFQGYITADCTFPLARGIATIFTPTWALSQAAEVITLPRPTTAPTYLLFQYVTNQSGFDTPIAIANTSGDLGLPPTAGKCGFYFYGSPPYGTFWTASNINAGTVYTNTIASMASGFQGYVVARCNFMGAAGLAFVTDLGAHNLAFSETPERLPIPRTWPPWPTTTRLLFPAVTNQNGLDTPFSLANTTSDPCGTSPSGGSCVLSFFGQNAPTPFTIPSVASGTVYSDLLSHVAPNFQGYMIAECAGTLGRGWAITLKAGATVDGGEQTPEILPPNWIPRDTTWPYPSLLFTGVTNWNGPDTKITISNTSRDQYGTPQSHGSCTINYFGDMADGSSTPTPQVSADIQAGQQLSFSLSQGNLIQGIFGTPGFRGYIIADCNFALARGLATVTGIPTGDTYLLTTKVYPPGGGSITPGGWFHAGTVVAIDALANPGYQFDHFSGDLSGSAHPQNVTMSAPKKVVANYAALVPDLYASISSKLGPPAARKWGITVKNNGPSTANAAQITGVTLTQTAGAACSPPPKITDPVPPPSPANPLPVGNLAPGASGTATVTIDFSGCVPLAQFKAVIGLAANGGSYAVSRTLNKLFR